MNSNEPAPSQTKPARTPWPVERIVLWTVLAVVAVWHRGPAFLTAMQPAEGRYYDFFQEWASARNHLEGLPVYTEHHESLLRHTGKRVERDPSLVAYNAHPPASILLAIPFANLPYRQAHLAWNLTMLLLFAIAIVLIVHGLRLPFRLWTMLPGLVLVLYCFPLDHTIAQGQLNVVLLFLMTLSWSFDRNDYPWLAGTSLGLAAGFKLFPAYLFLYFLMRANWKALASGGASFLMINALALLLFGQSAFNDYIRLVLPSFDHFRSSWPNLSLTGFWLRLLSPIEGERVMPLVHAPMVAKTAVYLSAAMVTALAALGCSRSRRLGNRDSAFALCLVGMLLVSPITWNHYFLFLCLPFALLWRDSVGWERWGFRLLMVLMWIPPGIYQLIGMGKTAATKWERLRHELPFLTPQQNLLVASFLTYCLLALFILVFRATRRPNTCAR